MTEPESSYAQPEPVDITARMVARCESESGHVWFRDAGTPVGHYYCGRGCGATEPEADRG